MTRAAEGQLLYEFVFQDGTTAHLPAHQEVWYPDEDERWVRRVRAR